MDIAQNLSNITASNAHHIIGRIVLAGVVSIIGACICGAIAGVIKRELIPYAGAFGGVIGFLIGLILNMP